MRCLTVGIIRLSNLGNPVDFVFLKPCHLLGIVGRGGGAGGGILGDRGGGWPLGALGAGGVEFGVGLGRLGGVLISTFGISLLFCLISIFLAEFI